MYVVFTIAITILLMLVPDYLPTIAYWPVTIFLSVKYGFRKVSPSDWKRAHPTELAQLLMIGGPIYLGISFSLASLLSFIDEDLSSADFDASSYLSIVPGILIVLAVLGIIRSLKGRENQTHNSDDND